MKFAALCDWATFRKIFNKYCLGTNPLASIPLRCYTHSRTDRIRRKQHENSDYLWVLLWDFRTLRTGTGPSDRSGTARRQRPPGPDRLRPGSTYRRALCRRAGRTAANPATAAPGLLADGCHSGAGGPCPSRECAQYPGLAGPADPAGCAGTHPVLPPPGAASATTG